MGFDAHTHLDDPSFDADRDAVLARARAVGVNGLAIAGADPARWDRVRAVGDAIGAVVTLGIHPWWAVSLDHDARSDALAILATAPMDGLGECGLDYARDRDPVARATQRDVLRAQLAIARDRALPIVLHCVRAHADLLAILRADGAPIGGLVHAFSGSAEQVAPFVALGLHVSFGPWVLRPEARRVRAAAIAAPLDRLLLESDAPDGSGATRQRVEPAVIVEIAEALATLRDDDPSRLAARTDANARALWGLA